MKQLLFNLEQELQRPWAQSYSLWWDLSKRFTANYWAFKEVELWQNL